MSVLLVAEHDNEQLLPATAVTVAAATALPGPVTLLVVGHDCGTVSEQAARLQGVSQVRVADAPHYAHPLAENLSALVLAQAEGFSHILAPATTFGKNFLPRVAAMLDVELISDVIAIESEDTFVRPIYAGNVLARVKSSDSIKLVTVRPTAFEAVEAGLEAAPLESVAAAADTGLSRLVKMERTDTSRPELSSARVVVSGGRGMGSREDYLRLLSPLADKLGAALGASRAAVDAGYVPNDFQVGQTGKIVAPDVYFAVGISGAIQHLAGMKESRVIVAINKDPDAPIMQVADYVLEADLFEALPQLIEALDKPA